ncbi:MAG TPA: thiamine phosphate synthase [Candidatus Methanomethylophilaceae archaeon]|nr:thiamine phosphate synthase [Candidatus Methanomethylophilaceae archaeon]
MIDLYVITDSSLSKGLSDSEVARLAYEGGAETVQLRMKDSSGKEMLEQAKIISSIAYEMNRIFIVNDRVDIAIASDADGVHLGQDDMPLEDARKLMGDDKLIGISVGNAEEAVIAYEGGADYVAIGPIFGTGTKEDAGEAVGLDAIIKVKDAVQEIPVVAIGGINLGNIRDVIRSGADAAAVISAVVGREDIKKAAHGLRDSILKVRPHIPSNE